MKKGNYEKAYKEVIEILKYMPMESVNKIPKEMLDMFNEKMDIEHNFEVDVNKSFEEQQLLIETKAILANIFKDYWATPDQREKILAKEKYDIQKLEEAKREKYNPDELFKKKEFEKKVQEVRDITEKENIYKKITNFIKRLFKI